MSSLEWKSSPYRVDGAVLPQLLAGTLDEITVSSDDVVLGQLSGDVTVHATVPSGSGA